MISVRNLAKHFGHVRAVDGISFDVPGGELFGFLGPNGAGKTTTLSMISGLLRPDAGSVLVEDIDVWESPKRAKRLMGYVPQELALYEELTAIENLRFWGSLYSLPRKTLTANIEKILDRVGLTGRAKEPVSRFSGGMKRRLNLAIGLVHEPKVVLLDEPTVGIDPQARNNILDIIRDIAREGSTILFTTHHLEEAEVLCERIAIMDHGKILGVGSVEELANLAGGENIATIQGEFGGEDVRRALADGAFGVIHAADGSAAVSLGENHAGVSKLVLKLGESGIEISDLSIQKPSLESVFLKLTGRELRD